MIPDRLVIASFNKSKLREIREIMSVTGLDFLTPVDFGLTRLPAEDGDTFLVNAAIKAVHVAAATGLMAAGDDSGLVVDALDGRPGVHSARYAGEGHDDAANNEKLLEELAGKDERTARFVCAVALAVPDGLIDALDVDSCPPGVGYIRSRSLKADLQDMTVFFTSGSVDGIIIDEHRGSDGFGYDPIFLEPGLGLTFAEIPKEQKNELSHRGRAFRAMIPLLRLLTSG